MTNFNDYSFGVEIEFTGANTHVVAEQLAELGVNVRLEGYNHATRRHWKVTTDATVTEGRGYDGSGFGGELVSPVLRGDAGLEELKFVLQCLSQVDNGSVSVDRRCGVHVHLSWHGMTTAHIKEVYKRYAQFETDIDAWMAPSRRGNHSRWCASIARNIPGLGDVAAYQGTIGGMASLCGRYYKVNLQSLARYGTIEFRQHGGSIEFAKIGAWIKFLMGFVEASKSHNSSVDVATYKRAKRQGNAFGEIRELFAMVGWSVTYAGRGNWKIHKENGSEYDTLTGDEMFAFYVDGACHYRTGNLMAGAVATMNERFIDYYRVAVGHLQTSNIEDSVFNRVDRETIEYLMARTEHFAAIAA